MQIFVQYLLFTNKLQSKVPFDAKKNDINVVQKRD